jgi:hypothetical protein
MVRHDIVVSGVQLTGGPPLNKPVVLQMNREDFPNAFLRDLSAMGTPGQTSLSSAQLVAAGASVPGTLYQPVSRVIHVAMAQLACESVGYPRLDPKRVLSAGLVIRRVPRTGGVSELSKPPEAAWPWMKDANGQFGWMKSPASWTPENDPDPAQRPQLQSGQPALNQLLAAKALSTALTEVSTPAFVAAPDVCNAAGRTLVYALVPTASSEASTRQAPSVPRVDNASMLQILPVLLKARGQSAVAADKPVTYLYMSDEYAKSKSATDFTVFSATLRLLYTVFGAFDGSAGAQTLLNVLNRHNVTIQDGSGFRQQPMGAFYQEAAAKLIDYDPNAQPPLPIPTLQMPHAWDSFTTQDQNAILGVMAPLLQARSQAAVPPQGRFQDASRLYRVRLFFRIKGETPACPPELVWSSYSDPFRIGAWYESGGRPSAPVPLPDPFDKNVLKNARQTSSFAVPPSLMNAMQNTSLTGLSNGSGGGGGGGINLTWICSFSIPLITICAFFVLNIFLSLLNIVFFWMAFIKICIPFPIPAPSASPTED